MNSGEGKIMADEHKKVCDTETPDGSPCSVEVVGKTTLEVDKKMEEHITTSHNKMKKPPMAIHQATA